MRIAATGMSIDVAAKLVFRQDLEATTAVPKNSQWHPFGGIMYKKRKTFISTWNYRRRKVDLNIHLYQHVDT